MPNASLVALAAMALTAPVSAAAPSCAPYAHAITLDFQTLRPTARTDNGLNVTALRNMMRSRGQAPAGVHVEALGVTFATPVFALDARTRLEPQRGGTCVYLESLRAEFGYRSLDVYVASEYLPGSCEFRAILDHENQHVGINVSALQTHAPRLRLELERILGEEKPVLTRDPRGATRDILNRISQQAQGAIAAFYRELDARNGAIDSQPNYDAIAGICKDWSKGNVWPQQPAR
jgi:hypothetical protein